MKIDMHCHSRFSERPSIWMLKKIGCAESYTEPFELYNIAKRRGMDAVTLTDHNSIKGALEIADQPETFISVEATAYFPDDRCKMHVLCYDISEAQFAQINQARENIFELVDYLNGEKIVHALAHAFFSVNDMLSVEHFEKCLLLFDRFEINGDQDMLVNRILREILSNLTPGDMERLSNKHGFAPHGPESWRKGLIGGSDDHSSLHVAHAYTEVAGARNVAEFIDGVKRHGSRACLDIPTSPVKMAHHLYGVTYQFYRQSIGLPDYSDHNVLMRFLDRMLQIRERKQPRVWKKIYYSWQRSRRNAHPGEGAGIIQLLQYEAQKILQRDPVSKKVLDQGLTYSPEPSRHWFRFVNQISNNMLRHLARHLSQQFSGVNPFDVFHTLGSGGALYTFLLPYFIAYGVYSKNRSFSREVKRAFTDDNASVESPRVGHFTDTFEDVNGVARTLQKQVELAGRTGKNLTMITAQTPGSGMERMPGVHYITPIDVLSLPEYDEQKIFIPPVLEMMQMAYDNDFTHVHAATPGPIGLTALAIARILRLPFITTYHTSMPQYARILTDDPAIEEMTWRFMLWFYDQSDMIFAPSVETANELIERGIGAGKIRIMPRGIDTKRFHPRFRNDNIDLPEGLRFLYVGRVSKEKNLPLLCRAFKRLSEEHDDAQLIIVGEGPYYDEMRREMADTSCHFTGYMEGDALSQVYASCDAFVFPSTTDTFGNVVLEAQSSGIPVIVSDSGGPQENLEDGVTGYITRADDEQSFLSAMRKIASDPQRLNQMKTAAREYGKNRDIEKAFDEYWEYYKADLKGEKENTKNDEYQEILSGRIGGDAFAAFSGKVLSAAPFK